MSIYDYFTEPKVPLFPDDKQVLEGEDVVFRVKVTGAGTKVDVVPQWRGSGG